MKNPSTTVTVARNSFWFGLELGVNLVIALLSSIAVARVIGPARLGYFNYVNWLTAVTGNLGTVGIPLATGKFIAEYLGRGETHLARAIFFATFRLQLAISLILTAAALALVLTVAQADYRVISAFLAAAMLPRMLVLHVSQANIAAENAPANVPGSVTGAVVNAAGVALSLFFGWDLIGISIGIFLAYSVELAIKLASVLRWIRAFPVASLPPELRRRINRFSRQTVIQLMLNMLVWGRSDIFFLKWLHPDIRQVTFFSITFTLIERILVVPNSFGHMVGASVLAQRGRDSSRLFPMVYEATKYMLLCSAAILVGAAALSGPAVKALYGSQYFPVIPVMALAALFALPKSVVMPVLYLFRATENLKVLIWWELAGGVLGVLLDILLIPSYGAIGAAIANGSGQTLAVTGIWVQAVRRRSGRFQVSPLLKILFAALLMWAAVAAATLPLPSWAALAAGPPLGAAIYFISLRLLAVFGTADRQRMLELGRLAPGPLRCGFNTVVNFLMPSGVGTERT